MIASRTYFLRCLFTRKVFAAARIAPYSSFWEKDIRDGRRPAKDIGIFEHMKAGVKMIKGELILWKDEQIEVLQNDQQFYAPGETIVLWTFSNKADLEKWIATSDKDNEQGESECSLTVTENRRGLFSGVLCNKIPKDGKVKRTGYCNIRTLRVRKSFKREACLDWRIFTHLVLRVRGDGRSYLINIATAGTFDVHWYDVFHYVLFTRGGPYWQVAKIPFSKFFLSSRGRVQDKQQKIPLNQITSIGISCGDDISGPFSLEIDFIGLHFDGNYKEEYAYEMYKVPRYIVGS